MKLLSIDSEGSKIPHHNPWDKDYYLTVVCLIAHWLNKVWYIWFDHSNKLPTPNGLKQIQNIINSANLIAAQNLKYDLNILRYFGIQFNDKPLHCTMVTEYLLSGQNTGQLSFDLSSICERRGLPKKLDKVKEYWDNNINTYNIPYELLTEYVYDDTKKVELITLQQLQEINKIQQVYNIQMEYIYTLSDMELNGLPFDIDQANEILTKNNTEIQQIKSRLLEIANEPRFNIESSQQLSTFLYGGEAKINWTEWVIHEYKNIPECKYYEKKFEKLIQFPGLGFKPLPRTQLKDKRYYSTDKNVITQLKTKTKLQKEVKELLIKLSNLTKASETLLGKTKTSGLLNKIQQDGKIHPSLNQAVTKTGRLSGSNPNPQNLPRGNTSPLKLCIISEFIKNPELLELFNKNLTKIKI